jgi:hypothetical protein
METDVYADGEERAAAGRAVRAARAAFCSFESARSMALA